MLIEQKIINPVSIFKRKIYHMDRGNDVNNGGWGGCGRGQFGGRGRGGQYGSRCYQCIRQGGQGQGSCGGSGKIVYNGNKGKHPYVELYCLPNDIDLNNFTFDDKKVNNKFTQEQ